VVFFGSPPFAVPSLQALHSAGHQIVAAVSQPDAPKDRGQRLQPPAVKLASMELGVPVMQPPRIRSPQGDAFLRDLSDLKPDVAVVAAYGKILPQTLLDLPRAGCVNLHASLLPRFRGASPIQHALLEGDAETGVCLMRMVQELDAGAVYSSVRTLVAESETAETLSQRLAAMAARLCVRDLPAVVAGKLHALEQDPAHVTFAPLLTKDMGRVDWAGSAEREARRVRAMTPWPGAWTLRRGEPLRIHAAEPLLGGRGRPGHVVALGKEFVDVACGSGVVRLLEVQPAGKRRMTAGDFARGARLQVADSLTGQD
jgi:methionyl-tRNA formyltransferase